jgi:hypothetical protein
LAKWNFTIQLHRHFFFVLVLTRTIWILYVNSYDIYSTSNYLLYFINILHLIHLNLYKTFNLNNMFYILDFYSILFE